MKPKRRLLTPILAGLLLIIVVLMVVASQQRGPTFTPPALPPSNGYDQLLEAAKLIAPRTGFYPDMEEDELATIVEQNRPILELIEAALKQPVFVPVDWTAAPGSAGSLRMNDLQSMRSVARALAAQSRWMRLSGDSKGAVGSAGRLYQLGTVCGRGGLLNDYLVGLAVLGVGLDELRRVDTADAEALGSALATIVGHSGDLENADQVIKREKEYILATASGFAGWQIRRNLDSMFDASVQSGFAAEYRLAAQQGLLLIHLALHRYHIDRDEWPESLDEIPAVRLSPLPFDPFTNQPFIYRLTDDGYVLYSVGENKIDDGGQTDENGMTPDLVFDLVPTTP